MSTITAPAGAYEDAAVSQPLLPAVNTTGRSRTAAPKRQRALSRAVHLAGAALMGTYVYAPPLVAGPLHLIVQVGVVPAVTISGLFIWKQAQIRRLLHRRQGRS